MNPLASSSSTLKMALLFALLSLAFFPSVSADKGLMDFYNDLLLRSRNSEVLHDSPIPLSRGETQQLTELFLKRHSMTQRPVEEPETDPKKRKVDRHSARILNNLHFSPRFRI
ncbi:hypothetical protein QR680_006570 [Steinernema hermaphroditum]|uniref:Uncharacterized protein n=1 Tax=Steinernema hermaphroditum TaxID=289476 RepID=A0AA39HY32_9BILA|nr:hypothetical protein QR680_006570 [Steinernema hermaphroditum]